MSQARIAEIAYQIWLEDGSPDGDTQHPGYRIPCREVHWRVADTCWLIGQGQLPNVVRRMQNIRRNTNADLLDGDFVRLFEVMSRMLPTQLTTACSGELQRGLRGMTALSPAMFYIESAAVGFVEWVEAVIAQELPTGMSGTINTVPSGITRDMIEAALRQQAQPVRQLSGASLITTFHGADAVTRASLLVTAGQITRMREVRSSRNTGMVEFQIEGVIEDVSLTDADTQLSPLRRSRRIDLPQQDQTHANDSS